MAVTAQMVKELRTLTSAGMMDCKKALVETDGNMEEAIKFLREKGLAKAAKKADRVASEGISTLQISSDAKRGVVLEVNSETDFVAKNEDFIAFVGRVANLIIEQNITTLDALKQAKFEADGETVEATLQALIGKIGENMSIRRFDVVEVNEGSVTGYIHGNGKMSVVLGVETTAKTEDYATMAKDICMQIAAMNPKFVSKDDVDQAYLDNEREILMQQALNEGKPQAIVEKMVVGRLNKSLKEVCLLEQVFVKDSDLTVGKLVANKAKELGCDIKLTTFKRYEVGEGIEKAEEDFASEVAATIANK